MAERGSGGEDKREGVSGCGQTRAGSAAFEGSLGHSTFDIGHSAFVFDYFSPSTVPNSRSEIPRSRWNSENAIPPATNAAYGSCTASGSRWTQNNAMIGAQLTAERARQRMRPAGAP